MILLVSEFIILIYYFGNIYFIIYDKLKKYIIKIFNLILNYKFINICQHKLYCY